MGLYPQNALRPHLMVKLMVKSAAHRLDAVDGRGGSPRHTPRHPARVQLACSEEGSYLRLIDICIIQL